jgi:alkylation response protein AidB-like acyl-CoA dehydrogenase
LFTTVGISHLTTSRQHLRRPAVTSEETAGDWLFDGSVPWVTGALAADVLVTGGTASDGRQLLAALPTDAKGIERNGPPELLALNASQTGAVNLRRVFVPAERIIAGPIENVMKHGSGGGAGSLTTSALAIGHSAAALKRLGQEAEKRPDLLAIYQPLALEWQTLKEDLMQVLRGEGLDAPHLSTESLRVRANSLVLRMTQAYLAATKGAGFLASHPASRMVREAMFFLVWSCPQPVLMAQLEEFACVVD